MDIRGERADFASGDKGGVIFILRFVFEGQRPLAFWEGTLSLAKSHVLIESNVLVPDQPEARVGHLNAPVPRLLQLTGDSGELVPQSFFSENQPQSGSNPPDICGEGVQEFLTNGPFELKIQR